MVSCYASTMMTKALSIFSLTALSGFWLTGQTVIAQTATTGWDYAIDSFNDGVNGFQVGGTAYEFFGMAFKQEGDNLFIALNANMPVTGVNTSSAQDGVVSWGDLFFNFSGNNFSTASTQGNLYAIRFAQTNNSNAPTLGVYRNVTAGSVTSINSGFTSLSSYNNYVQTAGKTPSLGDLPANTSYFNQTQPVLNAINTGNFVTGISFLDSTQLSQLGLNFNQFEVQGSETIGFTFDKNALPAGEFTANIFAECANDGMVLLGETNSVPEPLSILGSLVGVVLIGCKTLLKKVAADKIIHPSDCIPRLPLVGHAPLTKREN